MKKIKKYLLFCLVLIVTQINLTAFAQSPLVLVLSIERDASCALSEKVVYGKNKKINTMGGPIGITHKGKEYGARGCLLSLNVKEWEEKFSYCGLVGFRQPGADEIYAAKQNNNDSDSEFLCSFTKTPDGAFVFNSFGRRGSWCEFACQ